MCKRRRGDTGGYAKTDTRDSVLSWNQVTCTTEYSREPFVFFGCRALQIRVESIAAVLKYNQRESTVHDKFEAYTGPFKATITAL
jgi:hypothetical protein